MNHTVNASFFSDSPSAGEEAVAGAAPLLRLLGALADLHRAAPLSLAPQAARLSELCGWACKLHGIDIEVQGALPTTPCVVISNHLGYIDPVVLCSLIPCSPIAKAEIGRWALIGSPLRRLNVSFVERGNPASGARVLLRSLRTLRAGVSVLNFPEGTTSRGGLEPFHMGAFWLARRAGLPIVPIGMEFEDAGLCWVGDEGFLPHYARLWWASGRRRVRVSVGQPLEPTAYRSDLDLGWAARAGITLARRPYSVDASPTAAWE
jgi:1-acyl-sn-glycerol-3-phosphate acyltransferase